MLNLLLTELLTRGARLATPGEFTLRAFLNHKIDLTRAEAVLNVIDARSEEEATSALRQLAGGISSPIEKLRDRLLDLLAHLEAGLDFVDESDVDPLQRAVLADELFRASGELSRLAGQVSSRDRPESIPRVVIVGPPNAGKSRLFNAMLADDRAIVSPVAGTTRDYLSAIVDCQGIAVELVDTAGEEAPRTGIEADAQSQRNRQASTAELVLECVPADGIPIRIADTPPTRDRLRVYTKTDLAGQEFADGIATSAATGVGIDPLKYAIAARLQSSFHQETGVVATSARCRDAIMTASSSLATAASTVGQGGGDELVAIDLRHSLDGLGGVIGDVVSEDLLDRIFRRFCIGK